MLGQVIEDQRPIFSFDLVHALLLHHPVQELIPVRAGQALLGDQAEGMASVTSIERFFLARTFRKTRQQALVPIGFVVSVQGAWG